MALCKDCDAKSVYTSDGNNTDYNITFEYGGEQSRVHVSVLAPKTIEYNELQQNDADYPWSIVSVDGVTDSQVRFTADVPPIGYTVVVYRCTPTEPRAHFQPGHAIRARDLEDNFQLMADAIEENCDGLNHLHEHIDNNYWDQHGETVGCPDPWVSDDKHVATTCAIDNRFWDNVNETLYFSDDFRNSDSVIATAAAIEKRFWNNVKDDDSTYTTSNWLQHVTCPNDYVPTTGAVEQRLQDFYTRHDFDELVVTGLDQRTGQWNDYNTDDKHVPTTDAVVERHDTHYSDTPLGFGAVPLTRHGDHGGGTSEPDKENQRNYIQPGKFWVNTQTQRLAYWNDQGYWVHTGAMPANDAPPVYVSNEEPAIADEGDLWFNTGDGLMYVYYCPDPSGSCQWVSIGGGGTGGGGDPSSPGGIDTKAPLEHTYDLIDQKTTVKFRINSLTSIA